MLVGLIALLCATSAFAADVSSEFDSANRLYGQGKFAEAAEAYQRLAQSGSVSPSLYFNLGNAWFKSGQLGHAIAAWRHVADLTPRDPDLRANLQFARNQVQGPTLRTGRWERWLGTLNLNEWTSLAAGAVWLTFLLLTAMQVRPTLRPALRSLTSALAGAAIVLCACLGLALGNHHAERAIVVVAGETTVRTSPLTDAASAFVAHDGAELRVVDRKYDWLQVSDGVHTGWVQRNKTLGSPAT